MRSFEPPYSQHEIEEQLDDILCAALSSRRSAAAIAAGIAPLPRAQQDFVLAWAEVAAQNVAELGYQFTAQAPQALALFGRGGTEKWLLHALDAYDKEGLYPACADDESSTCTRLPPLRVPGRGRTPRRDIPSAGDVSIPSLCARLVI